MGSYLDLSLCEQLPCFGRVFPHAARVLCLQGLRADAHLAAFDGQHSDLDALAGGCYSAKLYFFLTSRITELTSPSHPGV